MYDKILWYMENIWAYVVQMLPCMAVMCILWVLCRPYRFMRLKKQGLCSTRHREAALFVFVVFCTGLGALTLFPHGFWNEVISIITSNGTWNSLTDFFPGTEGVPISFQRWPKNLIPFQEIRRIFWGGPWLWFMLWGNIGMFVPVGFFVALLWRGATWYRCLWIGFLSSCVIETIQLFIGRVSDIDDVILNTIGALLGYLLYWMISLWTPETVSQYYCQRKED